ncbi:insulinase family protein [Candidatus Dependentiae bacterium]|nr:insulinase family protein [Candidatus Dependentiae bacterium]
MQSIQPLRVTKHIMANGLTVLICPMHQIPKVSAQLWYGVGSKDELDGERGLAHFIEHMIFKGTDKLSESDIDQITTRLAGSCNAFTSYDYTGYLFDFPTQHWHHALFLMSECMQHCAFKQDHINSEVKAVVQELKMYRDDYLSTLHEKIISTLFAGHPYQHPIIGYKQDLLSLERQALVNFYNHHYHPGNAALVVVGDVSVAEVIEQAEKYFAHIPAAENYSRKKFMLPQDLQNYQITLYREVQQPMVLFAWYAPAAMKKIDYAVDIVSWIIASGKGSRLHKKLVLELGLATEVDAFSYDLFDQGMFFIFVQPTSQDAIAAIMRVVEEEIALLRKGTITAEELERAVNKSRMDQLALFENSQKLAYAIGKAFTATGDEQYVMNYAIPDQQLPAVVQQVITDYLRPSCMSIGTILPTQKEDVAYAAQLQDDSDALDAVIIAAKARDSVVEKPSVATTIIPQEPIIFDYPKYETALLSNGLEVVYCHNPIAGKVDIILDLAHKHYYDPAEQQGRTMLISKLLTQGTTKYSASALADAIERYGMSLNVSAGSVTMSMLAIHLERGIEILADVLTNSTCSAAAVERVKAHLLSDLTEYWDTPAQSIYQIAKETIYQQHPYANNILGSIAAVQAFTPEGMQQAFATVVSPRGSRLAIVGDLAGINLPKLLERLLASWQGPIIEQPIFPPVTAPRHQLITKVMQRDQVVLLYAGLSISRDDPRFDALLLFDQVFGGGVLGSMSSMLFALRQQSGLFYTISGSVLTGVDIEPGLVTVKTIVSKDSLAVAQEKISGVINTAVDTITAEAIEQAKQAVINNLVDNFATNRQIASSFLFLRRHDLPRDFFDKRAGQLQHIEQSAVIEAVQKLLRTDAMLEIQIGRF